MVILSEAKDLFLDLLRRPLRAGSAKDLLIERFLGPPGLGMTGGEMILG